MAVSITVQRDGCSVLLVATGRLTPNELLEANRTFFAGQMDAFRSCRTWLSDYSDATFEDVPGAEVKALARLSLDVSRANPDLAVALVVPKNLPFGLARMWEALADGTGWETMAFRSEAEARGWLADRERHRAGATQGRPNGSGRVE